MPTKTNPVLAMLKDDHKKVKGLFEEYKDAHCSKTTRNSRHCHS